MTKTSQFWFQFHYDSKGYGDIVLMDEMTCMGAWLARTGSIDRNGKLVNAIDPHNWFICNAPEKTNEIAMYIPGLPGFGWKWRLNTIPEPADHESSPYLLHPDGNLPGSLGCPSFQKTNAPELYHFAMWQFTQVPDGIIRFIITKSE